MADVEIYHSELDRTVKVPAGTVRIWKRSGWVEASERKSKPKPRRRPAARPITVSLGPPPTQLLAALQQQIDPPSADEPPTPGDTPTPHEED